MRQTYHLTETPIEGKNLIEASAGTGKTFTIENIFLRIILEYEVEIQKILVVTFTEAATAELKERIRDNLKNAALFFQNQPIDNDVLKALLQSYDQNQKEDKIYRLKNALANFDEASIFTIHGFCYKMLNENSFESSLLFNLELISDQSSLVQELIDDFYRKYFYSKKSSVLNRIFCLTNIKEDFINEISNKILQHKELEIDFPQPLIDFDPLMGRIEKQTCAILQSLSQPVREQIVQFFQEINIPKSYSKLIKINYEMICLCESLEKWNPDSQFDPQMIDLFFAFGSNTLEPKKYQNELKKRDENDAAKIFLTHCQKFTRLIEECSSILLQWLIADIQEQKNLLAKKENLKVQSFDDLLMLLQNGLKNKNGNLDPESDLAVKIRQKFSFALIDEFQDTDPVQFDIFKTLFDYPKKVLYLVGDPKQSIYGFRGADIFSYRQVLETPNINLFHLSTNYRSTPDLIKAVNLIFSANQPFCFDFIQFLPVNIPENNKKWEFLHDQENSSALEITHLTHEKNLTNKTNANNYTVDFISAQISRLLNSSHNGNTFFYDQSGNRRTVQPEDIAVLVNSNMQAGMLKLKLDQLNIPAVLQSTESVFQSQEAMELLYVLESIENPVHLSLLRRALSTSFFKQDAYSLAHDDLQDHDEFYSQWQMFFYRLLLEWSKNGYMKMFRKLLRQNLPHEANIYLNLLEYVGCERKIINLNHISELIHQHSEEKELNIHSQIIWLKEKIEESGQKDNTQEESEIRLEKDENSIQIMTIHKSKGLEFPIVFCPFFWEKKVEDKPKEKFFIYHKKDQNNPPNYKQTLFSAQLFAMKNEQFEHFSDYRNEELSNNMRLFYVALTRARTKLFLTHTDYSTEGNPCDFFLDSLKEKYQPGQNVNWSEFFSSQDWPVSYSYYDLQENQNLIGIPYDPPHHEKETLIQKKLNNFHEVEHFREVMSYSSLSHKKSHSFDILKIKGGEDEFYIEEPGSPQILTEDSFFHFPKGKSSGNCVHEILENFEFMKIMDNKWKQDPDLLAMINDTIEKWLSIPADHEQEKILQVNRVLNMIENVLSTPLTEIDQNFALKSVPKENMVPEMKFYYPVNRLIAGEINSLFKKYGLKNSDTSFDLNKIQLLQLDSDTVKSGFMGGLIDLIFEHHGKYYIADWKISWLGDQYPDYHKSAILKNMIQTSYLLQYHLYTVALHLYLKNFFADYAQDPQSGYEKYFGGVFYIYLRGMDGKSSQNGYFFDRPSFQLIDRMSTIFTGLNDSYV